MAGRFEGELRTDDMHLLGSNKKCLLTVFQSTKYSGTIPVSIVPLSVRLLSQNIERLSGNQVPHRLEAYWQDPIHEHALEILDSSRRKRRA